MRGDGMASPFFPPSFLLQMQVPMHEEEDRELLHIPYSSSSVDQDFHGLAALLGKRSGSFPGVAEPCEEEDLYSDDCSLAGGGKKRRLSVEQVRTLDRNFEMGNRLEPERKMQLARVLGLQPRQVAIWFQNRRARWKTKQLEKDYDDLKRQLVSIKEDNDAIHSHNKELEAEITALIRAREASEPTSLNKETDIGCCSNRSDNSTKYVNLQDHMSRTPAADHDEVPMAGTHHRELRSFQPAVRPTAAAAADQLLQYPSLGPEPHRSKLVEHSHGVAQVDESFCNMFPAIDDQPGFCWAWTSSEKQSFH